MKVNFDFGSSYVNKEVWICYLIPTITIDKYGCGFYISLFWLFWKIGLDIFAE